MNWFSLSALAYLLIAILCFCRYCVILERSKKAWREESVEIKMEDFVPKMIGDSIVWGYYVVWYGLKQFIEELK